jgi:PTS system cellobiose-specific IIA component
MQAQEKNQTEETTMAMTPDEYDEMIMSLVVQGGNARSLAMEAIGAAKAGKMDEAEQLMQQCEEALNEAHNAQTDMIQAEIRGETTEVKLLMVHAQDHLMDALVVKDMAREIIDLYKKIG